MPFERGEQDTAQVVEYVFVAVQQFPLQVLNGIPFQVDDLQGGQFHEQVFGELANLIVLQVEAVQPGMFAQEIQRFQPVAFQPEAFQRG